MYEIIQPPFTLKFRDTSKEEIVEYGRWFHASIPERLCQLEAVVRETSGYESWEVTHEPDSLQSLGNWFTAQIDTRSRTVAEVAELRSLSPMLGKRLASS